MKLILGSNSPRRKEILQFFSIPFEQADPGFDESEVVFEQDPEAFAIETARRKALCLAGRFPEATLLTADTVVYRDHRLFLKPESLEEAHAMVRELAGKDHWVFTGVCIVRGSHCFSGAEKSRVFFHELTEPQIRLYHRHVFPLDKAGGYAIQKGGGLIVKRIEGCYYNIMGLPIDTTRRLLLKAGIDLWDYL